MKVNRRIACAATALSLSLTGIGLANSANAVPIVLPSIIRLSADTNNGIRLTIDGRRDVGQSLVAELSGVPNGATVQYQWFRNGNLLQNATNRGRGITPRDGGQELSVRVTISRAGHDNIVLRSSTTVREYQSTATPGGATSTPASPTPRPTPAAPATGRIVGALCRNGRTVSTTTPPGVNARGQLTGACARSGGFVSWVRR